MLIYCVVRSNRTIIIFIIIIIINYIYIAQVRKFASSQRNCETVLKMHWISYVVSNR